MSRREELLKKLHGMTAVHADLDAAHKRAEALNSEVRTAASSDAALATWRLLCRFMDDAYEVEGEYEGECNKGLPEWLRS